MMSKQASAEVFDFTSSFQRTLDRFENLGKGSKTDYERARSKLLHENSKPDDSAEGSTGES